MIVTQIDLDELKQSVLCIVLEADNLERMSKADPVTLQSGAGFLKPIKYPSFGILIAYEPDSGPIYEMLKNELSRRNMISHLMRGYKMTDKDGLRAERIIDDDAKAVGAAMSAKLQEPAFAALFADVVNSMIAPVTQAWDRFALDTIVVKPGDIRQNDLRFTLTLTAKRKGT